MLPLVLLMMMLDVCISLINFQFVGTFKQHNVMKSLLYVVEDWLIIAFLLHQVYL